MQHQIRESVVSIAPRLMAAMLLAASTGVSSASAQDRSPMQPDPRNAPAAADENFTMLPAEGRHLKIDRRNGRVSICSETNDIWSCRLVADDRLAYEEEIERLETTNDRLAARIEELETELASRNDLSKWIDPEDEKKLDEFLNFSDKALRRFFGMVQDLKRDLDQPDSL
jgi:cell division protein FtsB